MPLTIEHSLKRTLDLALQKKLLDDVTREPNFAEKADKLLTESDDIAGKRRDLSEQKARLLQIRERLLDVDEDDMTNGTPMVSRLPSPAQSTPSLLVAYCGPEPSQPAPIRVSRSANPFHA